MAQQKEQREVLVQSQRAVRLGPAPEIAIAQAASELAGTVGKIAFDAGARQRQREAQVDAGEVEYTRDEQGRVIPPELPEYNGMLGPTIYQDTYEKQVLTRYRNESALAAREKAVELEIKHANDPMAFDQEWSAWSESALSVAHPSVRAEIGEQMNELGSSTKNGIVQRRSQRDFEAVVATTNEYLNLRLDDINRFMGSGDAGRSFSEVDKFMDVLREGVESGAITTEASIKWRARANAMLTGGQLAQMINAVPGSDEGGFLHRSKLLAQFREGTLEVQQYGIDDNGNVMILERGPVGEMLPEDERIGITERLNATIRYDEAIRKGQEQLLNDQITNIVNDRSLMYLETNRELGQPIIWKTFYEHSMQGFEDADPTLRSRLYRQLQSAYNQANVAIGKAQMEPMLQNFAVFAASEIQKLEQSSPGLVELASGGLYAQPANVFSDVAGMTPGNQVRAYNTVLDAMRSQLTATRRSSGEQKEHAALANYFQTRQVAGQDIERRAAALGETLSDAELADRIDRRVGAYPPLSNNEHGAALSHQLSMQQLGLSEFDPTTANPAEIGNFHATGPGILSPVLKDFLQSVSNPDVLSEPEQYNKARSLVTAMATHPKTPNTLPKALGPELYNKYQVMKTHMINGPGAPTNDLIKQLENIEAAEVTQDQLELVNRYIYSGKFNVADIDDVDFTPKDEALIKLMGTDMALSNRIATLAAGRMFYHRNNAEAAMVDALQMVGGEYTETKYGWSPDTANEDWYWADVAAGLGMGSGKHFLVQNASAPESWYENEFTDPLWRRSFELYMNRTILSSGDWDLETQGQPKIGQNFWTEYYRQENHAPKTAFGMDSHPGYKVIIKGSVGRVDWNPILRDTKGSVLTVSLGELHDYYDMYNRNVNVDQIPPEYMDLFMEARSSISFNPRDLYR